MSLIERVLITQTVQHNMLLSTLIERNICKGKFNHPRQNQQCNGCKKGEGETLGFSLALVMITTHSRYRFLLLLVLHGIVERYEQEASDSNRQYEMTRTIVNDLHIHTQSIPLLRSAVLKHLSLYERKPE